MLLFLDQKHVVNQRGDRPCVAVQDLIVPNHIKLLARGMQDPARAIVLQGKDAIWQREKLGVFPHPWFACPLHGSSRWIEAEELPGLQHRKAIEQTVISDRVLAVCFLGDAFESAVASDRRAGKWRYDTLERIGS